MTLVLLIPVSLLLAWTAPAAPAHRPSLTYAERTAIHRISADSLRGRLSFLASDLLEGRGTPSRGLDIAAEYIASVFRGDGLDAGGDDGYLQTAHMIEMRSNPNGFALALTSAGEKIAVPAEGVSLSIFKPTDFEGSAVFKLDMADASLTAALKPEQLNGKAVLMQGPSGGLLSSLRKVFPIVRRSHPLALIMIGGDGMGIPEGRRLRMAGESAEPHGEFFSLPMIHSSDPRLLKLFASLPAGDTHATAALHVAAPAETPATVHNVVGILRGSDPKLRDTCVLVTAHYDHLGMKASGDGDRIYNGANDDGSGTASVMELAGALSGLKIHPRRSIVFVTFFGEEEGDLGSHYYAAHPAFPIAKTVADINLEQVGRTDSTEGPQLANASVTGFGYSTVTDVLVLAGRLTGVRVYKHPKNSDAYFALSDNQALADAGVPAHTLCVAFDYPDYHKVGDEWPKVNYANMAKVDGTVAVALLRIANSSRAPEWNAKEPKAARYIEARQGAAAK